MTISPILKLTILGIPFTINYTGNTQFTFKDDNE